MSIAAPGAARLVSEEIQALPPPAASRITLPNTVVSSFRSCSKCPAKGLRMIAATATLRSGGSIRWPASPATSSMKVSVRLICIARPRLVSGSDNYLTQLAIQARYSVLASSETPGDRMPRSALKPAARPRSETRPRSGKATFPLTTSRPQLLVGGRDRDFRHLVHGLFGFAAHHERIRSGHARVIGLAGIEYTVLISIAHLSLDGDVNVKT